MTKKEISKVNEILKVVFGNWHGCRLLTGNEVEGGKRGQLCDVCEDEIKMWLKEIGKN